MADPRMQKFSLVFIALALTCTLLVAGVLLAMQFMGPEGLLPGLLLGGIANALIFRSLRRIGARATARRLAREAAETGEP